jgi:hypothetical protein
MKIKKYKMMFGSGKGSKGSNPRSANHTAKRLKSYTNQSYKAQLKLAGLTGELEQKAEKRTRNRQGQLSSDGTLKKSSQLKLEKKVSAAFAKVKAANVGMAKHTIRSVLATELNRAPTYAAKQSLITKANDQLKFTQAKAESNIATTELARKESRPSQKGLLPTQLMLQLAKNKSLANRKMINATTGLQTQNIKNTLKKLQNQSSSKNQKAAEKRLAYYTIKKITANATKAKAIVELQRKKARNPTNPIYTSAMEKLAKQSSRAGTQSIQAGISMEKHQGRLSGVTPFTSAKALTSVATVLKPGTGVARVAEVLKPLATSVEKVLQSQTNLPNLPNLEIQKQELPKLTPLTQLETVKPEDIKLLETTDPDTNTLKLLGEKTVVSPLSPNSSSPSLVKTTLNKPFIIQPHKTQLEILKEKEDTTIIHSTELNALLNSFMKGDNITTPKNMEEILKASKINNNTISKIKNPDGTITQDKIKLFLSTPETITKLQNYQTQLDTNKSKITENISKIEANTTKLHTIQETHTEYKTIKSDIETKQATINELKARQQLLFNSNQMNKLDTPANLQLQKQINNAETEKTSLETKKTELKTKLVENTKDLTQTLVKSKSLNNQIKQIEQNPDVYYGQMMSKYKTANTTKNEAYLKTYILAYGSPAEKEIIKLKNSSNHQKQEKKSMIETKTQTKVNLEAQIKELEAQKTNINKEDITKKNQELEKQKLEQENILKEKTDKLEAINKEEQILINLANEKLKIIDMEYTKRESNIQLLQNKSNTNNSSNLKNQINKLEKENEQYISEMTIFAKDIEIKENKLNTQKQSLFNEKTNAQQKIYNINKEKATIVSQLEKDATITKEIAATQTQISEVDAELEKAMPVVKEKLVEEPLKTELKPLNNPPAVVKEAPVVVKEAPSVVKEAPALVNSKVVKKAVANNNNTNLSPEFTQSLQKKGLQFNTNANLKEKTEAELAAEENKRSGYMDL